MHATSKLLDFSSLVLKLNIFFRKMILKLSTLWLKKILLILHRPFIFNKYLKILLKATLQSLRFLHLKLVHSEEQYRFLQNDWNKCILTSSEHLINLRITVFPIAYSDFFCLSISSLSLKQLFTQKPRYLCFSIHSSGILLISTNTCATAICASLLVIMLYQCGRSLS